MKQISSFHNYFKKELTWFFYAVCFLGLLGNTIDAVAFINSWDIIFFYYNLVTIAVIVASIILFKINFIELKTGFVLALYAIFINMIGSNITDIFLGQVYDVFLLREALFACFLITSAFLMVGAIHGQIIGGIFIVYFAFSAIHSQNAFLLTNLPNLLILFVSYVLVLGFFQRFLNKAIIKTQEDSVLIKDQNEEFRVVNQELTAVNEELHESQKQINAQHEELVTLSESLAAQNKELEDKNLQLEDAIYQKAKLFSIIAHDLKSPILSITSLTELMLERYDSMPEEKKIKWLTKILNSNKLLYELLENLLMWSRSQTGMIALKPDLIDMNETIDKIISIYRNYASSKSIQLVKQVDDNVAVYADRMMIETILRNLISNAIKYSFENGIVSLCAEKQGQNVVVSVKDHGVGIQQSRMKNLFSLEDDSITLGTSGEKGTGLGLRISKEFIEKHNGKINVESEEEKGTTISFSLPKVVN